MSDCKKEKEKAEQTISSGYHYIDDEGWKEHPSWSSVKPTIFDLLNIEYTIENKNLNPIREEPTGTDPSR